MKAGMLMAAAAEGVERGDVCYILADLMNCQPVELPLLRDRELSTELVEKFWSYHSRLAKHEPPQYILGKCWFHGWELEVDSCVLIPRPETEGLVEIANRYIIPRMRVLDIGTGSGAISIAVQKLVPNARITATEISSDALELASRNAERHGCEIDFQQADLFPMEPVLFDLIISNPPYISQSEYAGLDPKVRDYEPSQALLAEEEGLEFYRRILEQAGDHLTPEGLLLFEHGALQRDNLCSLASKLGYRTILAETDLAGRDRYLGFMRIHKGHENG